MAKYDISFKIWRNSPPTTDSRAADAVRADRVLYLCIVWKESLHNSIRPFIESRGLCVLKMDHPTTVKNVCFSDYDAL